MAQQLFLGLVFAAFGAFIIGLFAVSMWTRLGRD
jgi:hypothetical protein